MAKPKLGKVLFSIRHSLFAIRHGFAISALHAINKRSLKS